MKNLPKCCGICENRIVDKQNGDRCKLLQHSIMDNRYTYDAELLTIMNFRYYPCPLERMESEE